jgi:hypothetical protein
MGYPGFVYVGLLPAPKNYELNGVARDLRIPIS